MKFVSFLLNGESKFGIYDNKSITDLTGKIDGAVTLKELISKKATSKAIKYVLKNPGNINLDQIKYLPVIPNPGKIVCVGLNYSEHVKETGRSIEQNPVIFFRVPESQTAHNQPILKPKVSKHLDYECEMAVIMGNTAKHIKPEDALKHIVGYSCYNESTIRDWQQHTSQFGMGKNFEKTGSFGPYMVLAENISDYKELSIKTRLNGKIMQDAKLNQLIFDIPLLISYVSKAIPWRAGDVLVTGTPGGVGFKRKPPIYMNDGDKVEVEISKIGTLTNIIKDEVI
tara:strand:- start:14520 stop:15371 length:852 start_codon:yes stop_codon:yes gene_type:complete